MQRVDRRIANGCMKLRRVFLAAVLSAEMAILPAIAQPVPQPADRPIAEPERTPSTTQPGPPGLPDSTARDRSPSESSSDKPRSEVPHAESTSPPQLPSAAAPSRPERSALPALGSGQVHRVGPAHALKLPSDAAKFAKSGDIVEIDAGVYSGDVAVWSQSNLNHSRLAAEQTVAAGRVPAISDLCPPRQQSRDRSQ